MVSLWKRVESQQVSIGCLPSLNDDANERYRVQTTAPKGMAANSNAKDSIAYVLYRWNYICTDRCAIVVRK